MISRVIYKGEAAQTGKLSLIDALVMAALAAICICLIAVFYVLDTLGHFLAWIVLGTVFVALGLLLGFAWWLAALVYVALSIVVINYLGGLGRAREM